MIIFRYISREVLASLVAVSGILLVIIMSGRFVAYLVKAARGDLAPEVLLHIMALRLPGFLELILPLGLFLGVLLGFGRLYLDSEISVLAASGVSQKRLVLYAMGPAVITAAVVATMSLYLSPLSGQKIATIWKEQEARPEIERVTAGRFQVQNDGRVTYVESVNEDGKLEHIFIAQRGRVDGTLVAMLSASGQKEHVNGQSFLVLENGRRFEGQPGRFEYTDTAFFQYGVRIKAAILTDEAAEIETRPTSALLDSSSADAVAQLHWRFSLPVMVLIVALMAVPMARVNPRQGRYARLVPSILLYLFYLMLLSGARSKIEDGGSVLSIWSVHVVFFIYALNLIVLGAFWGRLLNRIPVIKWRFWQGKSV